MKLQGSRVYLSVMELEDCKTVFQSYEYDHQCVTEPMNIGHSIIKAEKWFQEIQEAQGKNYVRLGIFLTDGQVIGDVALQDIDWRNRSCTLGIGISKIAHRSKGYGSEALGLLLEYAFNNLGLERLSATVLEQNKGSQQMLIKNGFQHEGTERKAENFAGRRWDRLHFGLLRDEYNDKQMI